MQTGPDSSPQEKLAAALGFSADNLALNQNLSLSTAQCKKLRWFRMWKILGYVFVLALYALVLARVIINEKSIPIFLSIISLVVVFSIALVINDSMKKYRLDLNSQQVAKIQGVVTLVKGKRGLRYVDVNDFRFVVINRIFEALESDVVYTLYYTLHTKIILSAVPGITAPDQQPAPH